MTVVSIRALAIALAAMGLAGPACAQSLTSGPGGESAGLRSLVWRPGAGDAARIEVARHHKAKEAASTNHRRAAPARKGRKGRHEEGVEHARGEVEASANATHDIVVHKGDTINSIAEELGTTPEAIMKANHLRRPRDLSVGRKLKVPTPKTYTVQPGDTLYSIHRRFDVPVDALKTINGLGASAKLQPGQKIDLPGAAPAPAAQPEEETPAPAEKPAPSRRERGRARAPVRSESSESGSAFETPIPPPAPTPRGEPSQPIPYTAMGGARPAAPPPSYAPPPASAPPPAYAPPPAASAPPPATAAGPTDAQVAAAGKGRFIWPTQGAMLSGFGPKPGGQRNDGVDIAAPVGAPVLAAASGDVVYAGSLVPGFGILVLVKHEDGWVTAYAHLSKAEVKIRDHVVQGAEIGQVGASGGVDQPQLHFEVRYAASPLERARPIDPTLVLPVTATAPAPAPAPAASAPASAPATATPLPPLPTTPPH